VLLTLADVYFQRAYAKFKREFLIPFGASFQKYSAAQKLSKSHVFNEGYFDILMIMQLLKIIGQHCKIFADNDEQRVTR